MKYQSGAWLTVGLLGVGLLWVATSKTERDSARPTRSHDSDSSVAASVVAATQPAKDEENRRKPRTDSNPSEQRFVRASWRELDEDELLGSLNELSADDAELALQLAGEAKARFPSSPRAAERDYLEVRALVNLSRLDEAVAKARVFVAAHPGDALANDVARHLLTHPMHHPTEIGSR